MKRQQEQETEAGEKQKEIRRKEMLMEFERAREESQSLLASEKTNQDGYDMSRQGAVGFPTKHYLRWVCRCGNCPRERP